MATIDNVLTKQQTIILYRQRLAKNPASTNSQLMERGYPNSGRVPANNALIAKVRRYMGIQKTSNQCIIDTDIFYQRCNEHNLMKYVPVQPWPAHWKQTTTKINLKKSQIKESELQCKSTKFDRLKLLAVMIKKLSLEGILIDSVIYNEKTFKGFEYTEIKPGKFNLT